MEEKKTIGEKIKKWRAKKDLTQDALAKKADIPYSTIAKIESDVITRPTIQTVQKLAVGLGITLDELLK
ncbi:XRE family transcriptional regulator [Patescibacteria group bacterium]|nr:MAG: XRE family transcriptional regulator [Patescibacteria group bacterium]